MGIIRTGRIQSHGDTTGEIYVKALWFEQINSGASGTFSAPAQGEIVLDQWAAGVDALASTISSGVPTYISPATAGGIIVTATLDISGNWTLSGTPSAYPVAIIYVYKVKLKYLDQTKQLNYELIPAAAGVFTDIAGFGGTLSSADTTVQKALDTIDDHAHGGVLHARQHSIISTTDHTGTAGDSGYMLKADSNGLPVKATNTDTDVADAVTKKHTQNTDTGTTGASFTVNSGAVTKAVITGGSNTFSIADGTASLDIAAGTTLNVDANLTVSDPITLNAAGTAFKLPAFTSTGTLGELAAVGATGQYLKGATGAIPAFGIPVASEITIPNGLGTPTYDDLQDFLNTTRSAGRLTGGAVTKGTGATVSITAMDGMIFTGNTLGTSPLIYFKMPAQTSILGTGAVPNLQDGAVNWIYIDYAAGTPVYKATTDRSTIDNYTMFAVGRVWVLGATVEVQQTGHNLYNKDRRAHNRLMLKYGSMDHVSGAVVSALTVGGASGQGVQTDAGSWYSANTSFTTGAKTAFEVWYKTGGVWTLSASLDTFDDAFAGAGVTVFTRYQNGADLGTLTGNKHGVYWIFMCPEGDIYVVLGIGDYATIGAAQAATVPALLPPYLVNWGRQIGRVICQKSSATHYSVESSFSTQFTLSAATDHSSLANLTADDHTQYILVAGTRAFTGAQSMGTQRLTALAAPTTNGDAIRATAKITEAALEAAIDAGGITQAEVIMWAIVFGG